MIVYSKSAAPARLHAKKNKCTVVTEAHKESTCVICVFVCHVPGPREIFLQAQKRNTKKKMKRNIPNHVRLWSVVVVLDFVLNSRNPGILSSLTRRVSYRGGLSRITSKAKLNVQQFAYVHSFECKMDMYYAEGYSAQPDLFWGPSAVTKKTAGFPVFTHFDWAD